MKQFISNCLHNKQVRDGLKLWFWLYLLGSALCFIGVNAIVAYLLWIVMIIFCFIISVLTDYWGISPGIPDLIPTGIGLWVLWTILWTIDGIKQYNKHNR